MYQRSLTHTLQEQVFSGKILFLLGPRQVGKTTLSLSMVQDIPKEKVVRFDGDYQDDRALLQFGSRESMNRLLAPYNWILIDEGQKISNIGNILKMMVDAYKNTKQIIVTGSSSLHLLDLTSEPLTGRKRVYELFPISWGEIVEQEGIVVARKRLEEFLLYGMYPEVLSYTAEKDKIEHLREIVNGQLYRDILEFQEVKNADIIVKLLTLLALQIGKEVSYHELAKSLGINQITVERYIDLLEKSFVIFRVRPYFTNKTKEVTKMKKIYFYDLGIRNAILRSFQSFDLRSDIGDVFENFFLLERKKKLSYEQSLSELHFWRTQKQQEIDLVEVDHSIVDVYEIKWKNQRYTTPTEWARQYPSISPLLIHQDNFWEYL